MWLCWYWSLSYVMLFISRRVLRMDTSLDITRALKVSIRGMPKDWRRPPGRPRHGYAPCSRSPTSYLGLNSAWKYTQDREHWKHLVETATLQLGACSWWWWVFSMQQQTIGQNIAYIEFQFAWTLWHPFFRPSVRLSVTCQYCIDVVYRL